MTDRRHSVILGKPAFSPRTRSQAGSGRPAPEPEPDTDSPLIRARRRFADHSAHNLGIAALASLVVPRTREEAVRAVAEFRAAHPRVTAIAAFTDDVAVRILAALHDLGLAAPRDLAVIGFDATEHGALFTPALTSVHIDAEAHGRRAARNVLGLDAADIASAPAHIVRRESA
ncbi:DNA-binding LacI/PurR family transcriptional regulator [Lipingzhangella halophila]|uniref:DNA-binding LacI/PurR family transcriptional regulator n=1 Tax=Lipingzhangella halophila TaxID=1783352 RepID=A0A7W7RI36_9ACTN|nr:substrate-binding domain-containing protein [Lipingzhangella halophila]MBB4932302.1 DNA-binding LacI/PurR family transcriptional regulator [Lipingzhangella halophila]